MALRELVAGRMLEKAAGPTLLDQFQARQRESEKVEMEKQINLSNLATAEQNRTVAQQEMEQSGYRFNLEKQRVQQYGQLFQDINSTQDPAMRYEKAKGLYNIAYKSGDVTGLQMAEHFMRGYSPEGTYDYQKQVADLGLESTQTDIGLKKAQTAGAYADIDYQKTMGEAATLRAQGKSKGITFKPLQAQEKNDIQNSLSGMEWFDSLDGNWDKKGGRYRPGTPKAQAVGDISLGVDYLRQEAAKQGIDLSKEDAYSRLLRAMQEVPESSPITEEFGDNSWDSGKFRNILEQERVKLSAVGTQEPDLSGLFVNEAGEIVDANGNVIDPSTL